MSAPVQKPFISQELKLRVVSALLLAAIVLLMTWLGGQTYILLWAAIAVLVLVEFSRICAASMPQVTRICAFAFLALVLVAYAIGSLQTALLILAIGIAGTALLEIVMKRTYWASAGLAYAGLPFVAFCELRGAMHEGLFVTLVLFGIVWGADVLAYFAGRFLGGPKLAPVISPKKTWSGFCGGLIGSLLLVACLVFAFGYDGNVAFWVFVLVTSVVSQIGDLVESYVKRRFGVKDSGAIIPGHGGVLDRIDGLVFAGVFAWLVLLCMTWSGLANGALPLAFIRFFLLP